MKPTSLRAFSVNFKSKINGFYSSLILLSIFLLFLSARLFNLSKYGLWFDEILSLTWVRLGWNSLFETIVKDFVHPPLFYVLLKLWIIVGGESLTWLKIFPLIFAVAALAPLYLLCRELKISPMEFCLALIFISLNSYLIYYAQELRMYSMAVFFSLLSMWLFIKFSEQDSIQRQFDTALFAANLLLVYTHYFGWLVILSEVAFVIFWKKAKFNRFFLQILAVGLCFLPWGYWVVSEAVKRGGLDNNVSWIIKPNLESVMILLSTFHGTEQGQKASGIGFLIFLPPFLLWIWRIYRERKREDLLILTFLGLISALPIVIVYFASQILKTSVWVDRYLIFAAVPYILLLAVSISRVKIGWLKYAFLVSTILWSLGTGIWNIYHYRVRTDWINLSNQIVQTESEPKQPRKIFAFDLGVFLCLPYALGEIESDNLTVERVKNIADINERKFWFGYRPDLWKEQELPQQTFQKMNCSIEKELRDVTIYQRVELFLVNCSK